MMRFSAPIKLALRNTKTANVPDAAPQAITESAPKLVYASVPYCIFNGEGGPADRSIPSMQIIQTPSNETLAMVLRNPAETAPLNDPKRCMMRNFVTQVIADPIVLNQPLSVFEDFDPAAGPNATHNALPQPFALSFFTFLHTATTKPSITPVYSVVAEASKITRKFVDASGNPVTTLLPQVQMASVLASMNSALIPAMTSKLPLSQPASRVTSGTTVRPPITNQTITNQTTTKQAMHTYTNLLFQNENFYGNDLYYGGLQPTAAPQLGVPTISIPTYAAAQTNFVKANISFTGGAYQSNLMSGDAVDGVVIGMAGMAGIVLAGFLGSMWMTQRKANAQRAIQKPPEADNRTRSPAFESMQRCSEV